MLHWINTTAIDQRRAFIAARRINVPSPNSQRRSGVSRKIARNLDRNPPIAYVS